MLHRAFASISLIVAFALNIGCAADAAPASFVGSFLYVNAERTSYFAIKGGHSEGGPILPQKRLGPQNDLLADEALGTYAYDCFDNDYRCVKTSRTVFAVPRKQLSPKASYVVAGTKFTVITCLRGEGDVCQVALIKADCEQIKDIEACEHYPGGRARASHPGQITYFIYNEDFGITSLGFADEEPKDEAWVAKLARDYVLRGDVGLLKP